MDVFVGAEYIIANALIVLKRKGVDQIKVTDLQSFGINIQKSCFEQSVDAVFLLSLDNVSAAIYNFSDYFSYDEIDREPIIRLNSEVEIEDLESRFVGYLPIKLLKIILENAQKLGVA